MLDKNTAKKLEEKVIERIDKMYPIEGDPKLANIISKVATRATIITLQEYEKMNANMDSNSSADH